MSNWSLKVAIAALTLLAVTGCSMRTAQPGKITHVSKDEVFVLDLGNPHEAKLAVVVPSGEWITLVDGSARHNLMSPAEFAAATSIEVSTRVLSGVRFREGREERVPVFTAPGKYRFVISDNLETEPENMRSVSIDVVYD